MKSEAERSSETAVFYHITKQRHNPETLTWISAAVETSNLAEGNYGRLHFTGPIYWKTCESSKLSYLLRCKKRGMIPRSLQLQNNFQTQAAVRVYRRTFRPPAPGDSFHSTEVGCASRNLFRTHAWLDVELSGADWVPIDRITSQKISLISSDNNSRQCLKFEHLNLVKLSSVTSVVRLWWTSATQCWMMSLLQCWRMVWT
jgi:hypothetical protein